MAERALDPNRKGVHVWCATCGQQKCPRGRSAPTLGSYCQPYYCEMGGPTEPGFEDGCRGYVDEPCVGELWPGESEADFGHPVSHRGTEARP